MDRERAHCVLPFSCWSFGEKKLLGRVGDADWSIVARPDNVQVLRSDARGRVKFDIVMVCYAYGKASREYKSTEYLSDGEAFMYFSFEGELPFYTGSGYQGNIKVYFDPWYLVDNQPSMTPAVDDAVAKPATGDLLHLLDNPDSFSDAVLRCGDVTIPVHKCILSARSPVFEDMFKTETEDGVLNVDDVEPNVFLAMMRLVYSGKDEPSDDAEAEDLLAGAVKYRLEGLRSACVDRLKASMSPDNVFRYLVLGDMHDKKLKESAIDFICITGPFSELEKTKEWKEFKAAQPELAMDLLTYVVKFVQDKWCRPAELITLDEDAWFTDPVEVIPYDPPPPRRR